MPSNTEITVPQLSRLIGLPDTPALIDVRSADEYSTDPRLLPGSCRQDYRNPSDWALRLRGRSAIVICKDGLKLSQGAAAFLRSEGIDAQTLEGGFDAWRDGGQVLIKTDKLPARDGKGRTVWVTRARPKIDRIACPWLIRRFVDRDAIFLFVGASEVLAAAEQFDAAPFDIENVFWSHRGETCTFDTMIEEFGLQSEALHRLAVIVRGADTARPDLAPQAEGLLAASLGYSRMYKDDLMQLDAAMGFYDAFYRWCRDAHAETHNWPSTKSKA
jgi:rhodanese-related sulfurtransferase